METLRLFLTTMVLGFVVGNATLGESDSRVRVRRLAGGLHTAISTYPFIASILHGRKHVCGGTLISKNVILTAAHCIFGRWYKKMNVILGSAHSSSGGYAFKVSKISYHKDFVYHDMINDVALLRIQGSASSNKDAGPVTLFKHFDKTDVNIEAQGLGWDRDGHLKVIALKTISMDDCAARFKESLDVMRGQICTTTIDKGPAAGDSGGPLMIGGRQAGILSAMVDNIAQGHTNSYTEIAPVKDWIEKEIVRLNKPNQPTVIYHPMSQIDLKSNRKLQAESLLWKDAAYIVQILAPTLGKVVCTGTIVGPAHVLTSAECAKVCQTGYRVISNSNSLIEVHEERTIVEAFPNKNFHINDHGIPVHNIGLLLVSPSFLGNAEVKLSTDKVYPGEKTTIYGWNPHAKEILQIIHGSVTDDSECNEIYSKISDIGGLQKGQLCMSTRHGNCLNDKGGPLIIEGHQIGISSWRHPECADSRYPILYTKITPSYRSWIKDMIDETFKLVKNEIL